MTTSNDETTELMARAEELACYLNIPYIKRDKKTIKALLAEHKKVFVANAYRGLSYYESPKEIFFHPNMAFLRIKELERGGHDSFVSACGLKPGMSFFDGTVGLASDTLVAAYVVGLTGTVVGVERSLPIYMLTTSGLRFFQEKQPEWKALISRIEIKHEDNFQYLSGLADDSIDVIYFDFMFEKTVAKSAGLQVIKSITAADLLTLAHVQEALRVAKCRVVAKSGYSGQPLEELGFEVRKEHKRKNFYYGIIELG